MRKQVLIISTLLFGLLQHGIGQNFLFKEIPDTHSLSVIAKFDIKYYGADSLILGHFPTPPLLIKLDSSLNVRNSLNRLYVPDSIDNDSLQDVYTSQLRIDNDGQIRLNGYYQYITKYQPYTARQGFSFSFNHNFDSIPSKKGRFYVVFNDSIEVSLFQDSLLKLEFYNRLSQQRITKTFDSIVKPEWQTPGSLFWLRQIPSKGRFFLFFQSSNWVVITGLDERGNIKNQIVKRKYKWHNVFGLNTGLIVTQEGFNITKFDESLDTTHSIQIDPNEIVSAVIQSSTEPKDYYVFCTHIHTEYIGYYKWTPNTGSIRFLGQLHSPQLRFDIQKALHFKDSTFFIVGNIIDRADRSVTGYVSKLSGDPSGDSISINGKNYLLKTFKTTSIVEYNTFDVSTYPNPTSELITIETNSNNVIDYILLDTNGRILKSGSVSRQLQLDLKELTSGIYFLNLYNTDKFKVCRIIKN